MRIRAAVLSLLVGLPACSKSETQAAGDAAAAPSVAAADGGATAAADAAPAEPELTPEEQLARKIKERENAPEPVLNPEEPREKFQLVWAKGKDVLRSAQDSRYNLFLQMKSQKLKEKPHIEIFEAMMKEIENFGIGQSPAELEKAAGDICKVVRKLKDGAASLTDGPTAELAKLDGEIKVLEKAQEEGKTVFQSKWDKLEEARKEKSLPILAGRFLLLSARQILDEAFILAEYGPRRAQIELRDCLVAIQNDGGLPLDLAQASLDKVIARAKWYRELEE
jgi:hypothetical protein